MIYTDGTHLVGTHEEELHQFAESIGLKRSWFQEHHKHPHYDLLSGSIKHKAIAAGAMLVPSKKIIEMFQLLEEKRIVEKVSDDRNIDQEETVSELNEKLNNLHL